VEPACDHKREVDSREFRFGDEERRKEKRRRMKREKY